MGKELCKQPFMFGEITGEQITGQNLADSDCLFVISFNNSNCTGDKFRSVLRQLTQTFRNVYLVLPDTLGRHNELSKIHLAEVVRKLYESEPSPDATARPLIDKDIASYVDDPKNFERLNRELMSSPPSSSELELAKERAIFNSRQWLQINLPAITEYVQDSNRIYSWEDFLDGSRPPQNETSQTPKPFSEALDEIRTHYETNDAYRAAVEKTIESFHANKALGSDTDFAKHCSREFLLEELAVILQWPTLLNCEFLVYSGNYAPAMTLTIETFIRPQAPIGKTLLEPWEVRFKQAHHAHTLSLKSSAGTFFPVKVPFARWNPAKEKAFDKVKQMVKRLSPAKSRERLSLMTETLQQYNQLFSLFLKENLAEMDPVQAQKLDGRLKLLFYNNLMKNFRIDRTQGYSLPNSEPRPESLADTPIEVEIQAKFKRGYAIEQSTCLLVCFVGNEKCSGEFLQQTLSRLKASYARVHIIIADTVQYQNQFLTRTDGSPAKAADFDTAFDLTDKQGKTWWQENEEIIRYYLDLPDGAMNDGTGHAYQCDQVFFWNEIPEHPIYSRTAEKYSREFKECLAIAKADYAKPLKFHHSVNQVVDAYLKKNGYAKTPKNQEHCRLFIFERCAALLMWKNIWKDKNPIHSLAYAGTIDDALKVFHELHIAHDLEPWFEPVDIQFHARRVPVRIRVDFNTAKTASISVDAQRYLLRSLTDVLGGQSKPNLIQMDEDEFIQLVEKTTSFIVSASKTIPIDCTQTINFIVNGLEQFVLKLFDVIATKQLTQETQPAPPSLPVVLS